jgi:SAM-dependent methyltransferase
MTATERSEQAQAAPPLDQGLARHWPPRLRLLLISVASLYYELMLIRWLPTEVRILAYFSNVTLISCILGLGLGALMAWETRLRSSSVFALLAALLLLASLYNGLNITLPLADEGHFVWNGLSRAAKGTPLQYVALLAFFALNTAVFVPIGQMLGREFDAVPPVQAYLVNVAGALLGLSAFALFSLLGLSPVWWFAVGVGLLLPMVRLTRGVAIRVGVVMAIAGMSLLDPNVRWSPYYKVTTERIDLGDGIRGYQVSVNEDSHQQAFDLSGRMGSTGELATRRHIYDEPYRYGPNHRVLILGAGTGNDVAAALRAGAEHVDAVEIDPVILQLGRRLHPERPYDDRRVTVWNREARTFLRDTKLPYDKIVLGYVDSHSLFSAMSSVRLDNFLYTADAFREMRQRLTPSGVLAVTFTVHERWIADRLFALFAQTFGAPPRVFQGALSSSSGTVYLGGAPVQGAAAEPVDFDPTAQTAGGHSWSYGAGVEGYLSPALLDGSTQVPTDDWPYLYLRDRAIPMNYLVCVAALFLLPLAAIRRTTGLVSIRWPFFFLGAAFLLVETKAMTELAIFLGSTWTVNFFVIATVLGLIVLGTLLVLKGRAPSARSAFLLLAVTLVATYVAPVHRLLAWESPLRGWVAVVLLCLPLFFAAIIFARAIQRETRPSAALGSNLLGALAGGILEYSSMAVGFHPLYLFALGLYAVAWITFGNRGEALSIARGD